LRFKGINYRANIWLNGNRIADADTLLGAFRVFELDVTHLIRKQSNALAVEVFPPKPGDFSIGFVDWNPRPPDKNMGIWRNVEIVSSGAVALEQPFVTTKLNMQGKTNADVGEATQIMRDLQIKRLPVEYNKKLPQRPGPLV
jgi:exo-1,4-beta-D-glucosaminidase